MSTNNRIEHRNREDAENILKRSTNPNDLAWAHMILGIFHERELAWEAAVESYRRGIQIDPTNPDTLYFCNNNLAYSLIQLGRFAEAEPHCHTAIAIDQMRHNAHKNLGLVQEALGQMLDAASSYAAAAIVAPGNPRAWALLQKLLVSYPELLPQSEDLRYAVEQLQDSIERGAHAQYQ